MTADIYAWWPLLVFGPIYLVFGALTFIVVRQDGKSSPMSFLYAVMWPRVLPEVLIGTKAYRRTLSSRERDRRR